MKSSDPVSEGQSQNHAFPESALQKYLQVIFRGKWLILLSLSATLLSTAFFTYMAVPVYEATATILVDTRGPQASVGAFGIKGIAPLISSALGFYYINNELEILKSRSLAETVARHLMERVYLDNNTNEKIPIIAPSEDDSSQMDVANLEEIVKRVRSSLEFSAVRQSDVIAISARSTHPNEAALIVNVLARAYYDRNVRASRSKSRAASEFLERQLSAKKQVLDEAEQSLQDYMEEKDIVSLDIEAEKVIDQLSEFEARNGALDVDLEATKRTLLSYQEQLAEHEPNVSRIIGSANDPYIRLLQEQLARLEVQRDVAVAQNPSYVRQEIYNQKLKEIDGQIAALRNTLQNRTDQFLESLLPGQTISGGATDPAGYLKQVKLKIVEFQIKVHALEARKKALREVISQYEMRFDQIPEKAIQYARLQRTRLSSEKLYLFVEEKHNEAMIAEQSEFGYIEFIDPAVVPAVPVSPKTQLNLILGAITGLMLGLGIVLLREYLNVAIRMPEDLKKRGYVMLSAIAIMNEEIQRLGGKTKISSDGKELDIHLLTLANPLGAVAESYRRLRTSIQYSRIDSPVKTIVVSSPGPSEGKTTTVSNLAMAFAQTGKKVLLIDTDLRRPGLHRLFDLNKEPGLSQVLFGEVSFESGIQKTIDDNLDLLSCGVVPPNPAEILGSQMMRGLVEQAKQTYDVILFDSSPVLNVTDPSNISTFVDGVIIVVSAGETRGDALVTTMEILDGVSAKVLGIVLNNFDLRKAYGGYYGYYHYRYPNYSYGNYGSDGESEEGRKEQKVNDKA